MIDLWGIARRWTIPAAVGLLGVVFIALPLGDLFVNGIYSWHLTIPAVRQGGAELLVVLAVGWSIVALVRAKLLAMWLVAILGLLYLRLHHVDLPALVALLHLEAILAIGEWVRRRLARASLSPDPTISFLYGLLAWSFVALALSAVGMGRGFHLLGMTAALGTAASMSTGALSASRSLAAWYANSGRNERFLAVFVGVIVLSLMARSNYAFDYDSLWYGLRSNYVLTGPHSLFDDLGFVAAVYYYPKLFELYGLPLAAFPDFSFPYAGNVCLYLLLLAACRLWLLELGVRRTAALGGVAIIASLPVVADMAITAKPDILSAVLMMLGARLLWRTTTAPNDAWLAVTALLLAYGTKYTAIPFGTPLLLAALGAAALAGHRQRRATGGAGSHPSVSPGTPRSKSLAALEPIAGGLVLLALTLRTYLLTGLPAVGSSELVRVATLLGFSPRYPVAVYPAGRHNWGSGPSPLTMAWDFLFRPSRLEHVVFIWPGNVVVFLLLATLLIAPGGIARRALGEARLLLYAPTLLLACAFALGYGAFAGGDGNYYLAPTVIGAVLVYGAAEAEHVRNRLLDCLLVCLVAFHCLVMFVNTPSWYAGTRPFSFSLTGSPFDTFAYRDRVLKEAHLDDVRAWLLVNPITPCRMIADGPNEGPFYYLPCGVEATRTLESDLMRSPASFTRLVRTTRVPLVLAPVADAHPSVDAAIAYLSRVDGARIHRFRNFRLLDLRGVRPVDR